MKEKLRLIRQQDPGASLRLMYDNVPGHWSIRVPLTDLKIDQVSEDRSIMKIKLVYSDGREYVYDNPKNNSNQHENQRT